jgi:MraZ protein
MFQGASFLALDAKGRLSMPTKHRDVLQTLAGGELTLTRHPHGCVMVFPRPAWEDFRARIAAMPMSAQWMKRLFLGSAQDVALDNTGRILVAPELRLSTSLQKEVILLGMGEYFELWDRQEYERKEQEEMDKAMPEAFAELRF